ncbi:MAG TPA: MgtC/SapB family protein [Pirellulales bacterium]|nr:MgtC/SapB family protein [Pirellulales bacterium]
MPLHVEWTDIAARLALAVLASGIIGFNRGEHGRPAGLRTTLLVCLAACAAMIEANLLLPTSRKAPDSFAVFDLMRFPLGILSGIGFIGAGAILRRGDRIQGVTTAATLWYVTMMGLVIGGGQLAFGMTLAVLGFFVLTVLKWVEQHAPQEKTGRLALIIDDTGPTEEELRGILTAGGLRIRATRLGYATASRQLKLDCEVTWRGRLADSRPPAVLDQLVATPGILNLRWKP